MTHILLVRHGHVEGISPERFRGRADLPLTFEGRRQAEATARRIERSWRPAAVYSSPMQRCIATAATIGKPFALAPVPLEAMSDIDYGRWQGLSPEEVKARWPDELTTWYARPDWVTIPGGETLQILLARATAALRDITERHNRETVVLVGHDSINRVILLQALDLPLSRYWRITQEPCAINQLDFGRDGFVVRSINETDHLARE